MNGWLASNGKFVECDYFEHIESVGKHPILRRVVPDYDELIDGLESCEQASLDQIANDDHPSWHCYEMMQDDVRYEIRNQLMKAGFLRVGTHGDRLHFEGQPDDQMIQTAKDFAESHGMEAVFEKVRL